MNKKLFKKKTNGEKLVNGRFAYLTDIGKVRLTNEDQARASINSQGVVLLVVCDGMGGQNKGDYASNIALNTIMDAFNSKARFFFRWEVGLWLNNIIRKANSAINDEANKNPKYQGMGTTLSVAIIFKDILFTAQIGDSRIYALRDNQLVQLTDDQTYVGYLYRTGQITKEEMKTHPRRHMLMNALGVYPSINIDLKFQPYNGETLLVCSDGLYNNVSESTLCSILRGDDSPEQKINELIAMGNSNGGSDNMGIVIWESNSYGN